MPAFIIFTVCTVKFAQLTMTNDKGLEPLCNSKLEGSPLLIEKYRPYQAAIDNVIVPQASKWMCSKQCACDVNY